MVASVEFQWKDPSRVVVQLYRFTERIEGAIVANAVGSQPLGAVTAGKQVVAVWIDAEGAGRDLTGLLPERDVAANLDVDSIALRENGPLGPRLSRRSHNVTNPTH